MAKTYEEIVLHLLPNADKVDVKTKSMQAFPWPEKSAKLALHIYLKKRGWDNLITDAIKQGQ